MVPKRDLAMAGQVPPRNVEKRESHRERGIRAAPPAGLCKKVGHCRYVKNHWTLLSLRSRRRHIAGVERGFASETPGMLAIAESE